MTDLKPNEKRGKTAILLILIVTGIEIASLISDIFQYNLLQSVENGGITTEAANNNDNRQQMIAILYMLAYVISTITFIMWFRRAYYNLHIKYDNLSYSEGWAAGAWFVPIVSLFRPFQIMKELFEQTEKMVFKQDDYNVTNSRSLISTWWTLWIIVNVISQFAFRYGLKANTTDELTTATIANIIASIIALPLAFFTIKIIKSYAELEREVEASDNGIDLSNHIVDTNN